MLSCMDASVGVTQSDCQCLIKGLSSEEIAGLRVSTSGLYLDEFPGSVLASLPMSGGCENMAQIAKESIQQAIKRLEDDMTIKLNEKYVKGKKKYTGTIGKASYTASLPILRSIQGLRIKPVGYIDGLIIVKKIQLIVSHVSVIDVQLVRVPIDSVMGEVINTWSVNTVSNTYHTVTADPLSLPMIYQGNLVEYYLVYDLTGKGALPKDTQIECGTCGNRNTTAYKEFATISGVQLNTLNTLNDQLRDNYSHGLIVDVEIACDNSNMICNIYTGDEAMRTVMNYAVAYKANEIMARRVVNSSEINRFTTMDKPLLAANIAIFNNAYDARVDKYLIPMIDVEETGCFECRSMANQPTLGLLR